MKIDFSVQIMRRLLIIIFLNIMISQIIFEILLRTIVPTLNFAYVLLACYIIFGLIKHGLGKILIIN